MWLRGGLLGGRAGVGRAKFVYAEEVGGPSTPGPGGTSSAAFRSLDDARSGIASQCRNDQCRNDVAGNVLGTLARSDGEPTGAEHGPRLSPRLPAMVPRSSGLSAASPRSRRARLALSGE